MRLSEMIYTEEELQQEIRAKESWRDLYREQLEKNKKLKEELSKVTMVADDEKQSIEHILELEKENKKLKLILGQMENTCKDYLNDRDSLREEIKNLKEELGKITIHSNMLESENKLFKEELKARLDKIEELEKENKYRKNQIKELKKELKAKKELLRYYQKKS